MPACDSATAHEILYESDNLWLSYGVRAIFKMAAVSHVGFAIGNDRLYSRGVADGCFYILKFRLDLSF